MQPKQAFQSILTEAGGLESVIKSGAFIPRNRKQIYNTKQQILNAHSNDPILECTDMVKQHEQTKNKFIRDVRCAPEFTIFLASNRQLTETEKFCTLNEHFSVLGVDITFNLGPYFVTFFTYRHLMLLAKEGVEPIMIGPAPVHQMKTFESYFTLPSHLVFGILRFRTNV